MTSGWQQPAVPIKRTPSTCGHLGVVFASLAVHQHPEGHKWICPCGQVYTVVSDGGKDKRLVKTAG